MGRIKNLMKYAIKPIPVADDTVIGSDSQNNGKTVNFRIADISGNTSSLQNNRAKAISFGSITAANEASVPAALAFAVNSLTDLATDYKTILEDQIPIFTGSVTIGTEDPVNRVYMVQNHGKGEYGENGDVDVLNTDFILIDTEVNVLEPSGLEALDEGNDTGWRLVGRDPANYGNIGANAIDFSFVSFPNSAYGATGDYSVAYGFNPIVSGDYSFGGGTTPNVTGDRAFGFGASVVASGLRSVALNGFTQASGEDSMAVGNTNISSARAAFSSGISNNSTAEGSFSANISNFARSYGEISVGTFGTDYVPVSTGSVSLLDKVLNVGNGLNAGARSDAFTIYKSGIVTAPSLSEALITAEPTGRVLITKEYYDNNAPAVDNIYTADGTIIDFQDREVTLGVSSSLAFVGSANEVFIGENSFSVDAASWAMSDEDGNGLNVSNGSVLELIAYNGMYFRLGSGGVETPPTAGQALVSADNAGNLEWATISSPIQAYNEGNGEGYRLVSTPIDNVGNIGFHAVDLGEYYAASTTEGALATHAFVGNGDSNSISGNAYGGFTLGGGANTIAGNAVGAGALGNFNTISEGYGALASGAYNTINTVNLGGGFLALGHGNSVTGEFPLGAIGLALSVNSRNHLAVGVSNEIYAGSTSAADRPIFTVGIGTHTTPTGQWAAIARKDGFNVLLDGTVIANSLTTALIDAEATGKVLLTKEWYQAQPSAGGAFEAIDEGSGIGIVKTGRTAANFGNVGLNAIDLSDSSAVSTVNGATGNWAFAGGLNNIADSSFATAFGSNNEATALWTFVAGTGNTADGNGAAAIGSNNNAMSNAAIALGNGGNALAQYSFTMGQGNTASNTWAAAIGDNNEASGAGSMALGQRNKARSAGELSVGIYGTDYTPANASAYNAADRVFNVGIGTTNIATLDAFTILKGGSVGVGINNFEANDTGEKLQVSGLIKSDTTIAAIDAAGAKTVPTKEWVQANAGGASYTVYTALVTQVGTNDPTVIELQNDLGVTMTFARTAAGTYTITASGTAFTNNKTAVTLQSSVNSNDGTPAIANIRPQTTTSMTFWTSDIDTAGTTYNDDCLNGSVLEIRVYP